MLSGFDTTSTIMTRRLKPNFFSDPYSSLNVTLTPVLLIDACLSWMHDASCYLKCQHFFYLCEIGRCFDWSKRRWRVDDAFGEKTYFVRLVCNIDILNLGLLLSSTENNKYDKILSRLSFAGWK